MDLAHELKRYGPSSDGSVSLSEAQAYTRQLAGTHYENFPVISHFLPRHLRQHFANIYAFCRWADDLGDESGNPQQALELLSWWEEETHACFAGSPKHPVMVALRETVECFQLTEQPSLDLIAAFKQDQHKTRYETYKELLQYCSLSANPVGRIVLALLRRNSSENIRLSDDVCTGLQLINFWQDVVRDFAIGRIYLPAEDLARFSVTEAQIAERRFDANFARLMSFEVERAEALLNSGRPLAQSLPGRFRLVVAMFARGGLAIANKIRQQKFDVLKARPKLSKWDVASLSAKTLVSWR